MEIKLFFECKSNYFLPLHGLPVSCLAGRDPVFRKHLKSNEISKSISYKASSSNQLSTKYYAWKIRAHGSQLRKINQKVGSHLQSAWYVKLCFFHERISLWSRRQWMKKKILNRKPNLWVNTKHLLFLSSPCLLSSNLGKKIGEWKKKLI